MVIRCILLSLCLCVGATIRINAAENPGTKTDAAFVPLGVYWSWERGEALARYHGADLWHHIRQRLKTLRELNVNTVWFSNTPAKILPRLLAECEQADLKALVALNEIQYKKHAALDFESYYNRAIPDVVKTVGDSQTLIAWVLADEPSVKQLGAIEDLRVKFAKYDPSRPSVTVTIPQVTKHLPEHTKMPIMVSDTYAFFGPRDPNGPHTPSASRSHYRRKTAELVQAAKAGNATAWSMGQCFVEVWGPWRYDESWHIIALPGAYLHWPNVTESQMCWQIWETIRAGCRGVFIFNSTTIIPNPDSVNIKRPDVPFSEVLAKKPHDMGECGILNPDGKPSKPGKTMGQVYESILPYQQIIGRWDVCEQFVNNTTCISLQCFLDPVSGKKYVVVVNDDFDNARSFQLRSTDTSLRIRKVKLAAGDGQIIVW